jgi:hypothetical protein
VVEFAEAGSKPVVEVHATKYCLHCFQKEYAIHYGMYVRRNKRRNNKEFACPVT